ncbi:sulfite exporter TauE/SafE family protein [Pseudoxanthomonas dokdonensis]|uniref:sulfite exporter TauE/SafE family protein n=1 Tax=Pseudoxanthomonas dokdonensis TaxID=344882 RepID=UPI001FE21A60|nr:sulfite exporter TauE/SafE family protein [Pseudoxanthomonas dokdonensis]
MEGLWVFPLLGVVAGILAGLLGIGGGLVLVAALIWLLPWYGIGEQQVVHAALASSLASIVLTGASSAWAHHRRGSVMWSTVAWMVPGLLLGGWLGSGLAVHLNGQVLRWVVAGYCFIAAAQMAWGGRGAKAASATTPPPAGLPMTGAGGVIGAISAVVGIGGGSMTVPLLVWRGVLPVRAVGTSSACGVAIAIGSALGYILHAPAGALPAHSIGYVYLPATIGVAVAAVIAAPYGTRLAHAISAQSLKRVFAVFMAVMGVSLLLSG